MGKLKNFRNLSKRMTGSYVQVVEESSTKKLLKGIFLAVSKETKGINDRLVNYVSSFISINNQLTFLIFPSQAYSRSIPFNSISNEMKIIKKMSR